VLIVGGGTAGWITAAFLRRCLSPAVTVSLIESSAIPTVGVGEATLPGIKQVLRYIGIDEAEFLAECDGIFKHGILFQGWNPRRDFWHPFGAVKGPAILVNDWLRQFAADEAVTPLDEVLGQGTWPIAADGLAPQSASCAPYTGDLRVYAYHMDAGRYAELLKRHAIAAGVQHIVDDVTGVEVTPGGWVREVRTAGHGALAADLFFDCTGFRGLLINGALGEPFVSYGDHLWCDRAVAINVPAEPAERGDLPPYTRSTARSAGWIWEIPLFSRAGTGYVYSSAHLSPDAAEAELRDHLGIADDIPARHLRMRVGKSRRVWVGNCIAVGLSGGFIEPLESTGIGLIEDVAEFFLYHSPDLLWDDALAAKLNAFLDSRYDFTRDFILCHYLTSARDDTPFWRELHRDPGVRTPGVEDVLDQWHRGALTGLQPTDGSAAPFTAYSWAYIIAGNGLRPQRVPPDGLDQAELGKAKAQLAASTAAVAQVARRLPDSRQRVAELRLAWQRGERAPAAPNADAYGGIPHGQVDGYLTDGRQGLIGAHVKP
jgi:tryptophan halogenase